MGACHPGASVARLPRNDVRQYEGMADQWWQPYGKFAMLRWIAAARAEQLPPAPRPGALLVDLGCGAGLIAPHAARLGYRHVGVDLVPVSLRLAAEHGVAAGARRRAAAAARRRVADAVSAGEILEHVQDLSAAVAEACRVLRPGGTLVLDTIADTRLARLITVRSPSGSRAAPPPGIHDPALFVDRAGCSPRPTGWGSTCGWSGLRPSLRERWSRWAGSPATWSA